MCGICGIVAKQPVNQLIYDALLLLQHRGQDATGIATGQGEKLFLHKSKGMVLDVFHTRQMRKLVGNYGIGHVRYPTTVSADSEEESQPFYVNAPFGIMLAHNGNLTNVAELKRQLFNIDHRHINTESDTEVLLNVFANELDTVTRHRDLTTVEVFAAVSGTMERIQGGYAVVAMIAGLGILAFRDSYGIRPLCYGQNAQGEFMVASESVALEGTGFKLVRDIEPGEAIFIELNGTVHTKICTRKASLNPCIFEYIYLARPDSVLDGISIYQARLKMGDILAKRIISVIEPSEIDVVIPVPDSSRPSAIQVAYRMGKPYRDGFVKNRYIGRTFIMPEQNKRRQSVRRKLNAMQHEFMGRNVLLVDDSIVRGTTSHEIVKMAREAGAKKVFLASAAPPVYYPNFYGIDMPSKDELIANGRTHEEVRASIGCDVLIYQDLGALVETLSALNPKITQFDASCFDGHYVTGNIEI
ncbi:MAG: amidophosphoribosyltransferase [Saezia sp.]